MKKALFILFLVPISLLVSSQNNPYIKAMATGMKLIEEAKTQDDFLAAANYFERVAQVESEQWHPRYHASFARLIAASMQPDPVTKEEMLDAAQLQLDHAEKLLKEHSELLALQGFIQMIRIGVDPANRGQQYSGMSGASLQKSKALDPENPRAMYLLAQLSYGTAQFFGSGSEEACQLNEQALQLFEAQKLHEKIDLFAPSWGQSFAESFKANCQK